MAYAASSDPTADFNNLFSSPVILWTVIFIGVAVSLTFYILSCMGLMKIADKNRIRYSYLAWIPIVNLFLFGKLGFKSTVTSVIFFILSLIYPYSFFFSAFTTVVGPSSKVPVLKETYYTSSTNGNSTLLFIMSIISIIFIVMYLIALYSIYRKMSTKSVMMFIFSILSSGLLIPIFLFAIRNNSIRNNTK